MADLIDELAELLAENKLVPFFGAGISRAHLGFDAAELAREMAIEIGVPDTTPLSQVSDLFADQKGEATFINFLRGKLVVAALDHSKAMTHTLLVSLSPHAVYTTNQDNLFELVSLKYGRLYRRIVTANDMSDATPTERLLYKFHGDLDVPDSLVFGAKSYQHRMSIDGHPLDIRLRSDLLGKRLLFLGYSFKDENVEKLIAQVKKAFAGTLPPSYLVAFEYDAEMARLVTDYNIQVINPRSIYPDTATPGEAFERFLKDLCDETVKRQARKGLDDLFLAGPINVRLITDHEMHAVEGAIVTASFEDAVNTFRGELDGTAIPEHLQDRGVAAFAALVDRANPEDLEQMNLLRAAIFNFRLPPYRALEVLAHLMAACNKRPRKQGFDDFVSLAFPAMPDRSMPVAAAYAVAILRERREAITENFLALAHDWFRGFDVVHSTIRDHVEAMIKDAWMGQQNILMPQKHDAGPFAPKGFHEILSDIRGHFPKAMKGPRG